MHCTSRTKQYFDRKNDGKGDEVAERFTAFSADPAKEDWRLGFRRGKLVLAKEVEAAEIFVKKQRIYTEISGK